jgi:uncharacterized repeat protein (TIGR01451 family)
MGVHSPTAFALARCCADDIYLRGGEFFCGMASSAVNAWGKVLIVNDLQWSVHMWNALSNMYKFKQTLLLAGCSYLLMSASTVGETTPSSITVRAVAEVEQGAKLAPARRVVSGDHVLYTLEVRNTAQTTANQPRVDYAIPAHTWYVAESAVGPGTDITYSVDGGLGFDRPDNLRVAAAQGEMRAALANDYTHIRWQFKNSLKANSVAFVRFRVLVK